MLHLVFCVYDVKAEVFGMPIFQRTKGEALRTFETEVNRPESMLNKHPEDYSLFLVGTYNQETGELVAQVPLSLGLAMEYARTPQLQLTQDENEN